MRKYVKKPGKVINLDLAMMLHELFDEPLDKVQWAPTWGQNVVKVMLKSISAALHRGEDVEIMGFGTFYVKQPKPKRVGHMALFTEGGKRIKDTSEYSPTTILINRKKKVYFRPSPQLRAMLNGGINRVERRAMESW
jgi:nucleoid DNA-binding protein